MAITKEDVQDIITEWSEDELLSWQSKVEEALVDLASALFHEQSLSDDTKTAAHNVYKTFIHKPQNK